MAVRVSVPDGVVFTCEMKDKGVHAEMQVIDTPDGQKYRLFSDAQGYLPLSKSANGGAKERERHDNKIIKHGKNNYRTTEKIDFDSISIMSKFLTGSAQGHQIWVDKKNNKTFDHYRIDNGNPKMTTRRTVNNNRKNTVTKNSSTPTLKETRLHKLVPVNHNDKKTQKILLANMYGMPFCQGGCDVTNIRHLQIDHITPVSKDGPDTLDNKMFLCGPCNRLKSNDKELSEVRQINTNEGGNPNNFSGNTIYRLKGPYD